MVNTDASDADHRDVLARHVRGQGLRWTHQREVVLDVFLREGGHLTSEELHELVAARDAAISLSTVYRTLRLFTEAGVATERKFRDGVTRFEVKQPHHDHLICVRCGAILEFEEPAIEQSQEDVAERHGFLLLSHRHELYGHCRSCR